jgi:streptogramin lyase
MKSKIDFKYLSVVCILSLVLSSCSKESSFFSFSEDSSTPSGFSEGSSTASTQITPVWSKNSPSAAIDVQTIDLFNNGTCAGSFLFSIVASGEMEHMSITVSSSGTYSYKLTTKFKSGKNLESSCSPSIVVNLTPPTPPAPTFALFPISYVTGTGNFEFGGGYASGFSVDSNGNYLFGDYQNQRIQVLNPYTGAYITSFGNGVLGDIQDIEVDANGNIFAISYGIGQVHKFDKDFNHISDASVPTPVGLSLDSLGNVYVTSYTSHYVHKFSNALGDLGAFVSGGLSYPGDTAFDSSGNMWIANSYASAINKYDSSGTLLLSFGGVWYPRSVHVLQNGRIAVSDASYITYIFDSTDGHLISQFNMPGSNPFAPWSSSIITRIMPDGDMAIFYNDSGVWHLGKFNEDGSQDTY